MSWSPDAAPHEPPLRPLREMYPDLYGKLLETEAAIDDAGTMPALVYILVLVGLCCGVWFDWYREIPALKDADLNTFWVYGLIVGVWIIVLGAHIQWLEGRRYQAHREELLAQIERTGLTKLRLLALLEGDKSVKQVTEKLKRDRWERLLE